MLLDEKQPEFLDEKDVYEKAHQPWLKKYSVRADVLIEQHLEHMYAYLLQRKTITLSDRIMMLLCRESPTDRKCDYIFGVIKEFEEVRGLAKALIHGEDIMQKDRGTTHFKWEYNKISRYMYRLGDSETNMLAIRIINTAVYAWCQLRPGCGLEAFYVSTTVYETHKGRKPGEILMFMVEMVDEKFVPVIFRRFTTSHGQVMNPSAEAREEHTRKAVEHSITPLYKYATSPRNLLHDLERFEKILKTRGRSRWEKVPVIGRMCANALSPEAEERLLQWCQEI